MPGDAMGGCRSPGPRRPLAITGEAGLSPNGTGPDRQGDEIRVPERTRRPRERIPRASSRMIVPPGRAEGRDSASALAAPGLALVLDADEEEAREVDQEGHHGEDAHVEEELAHRSARSG